MKNKLIIFDWGGVIMNTSPEKNSDKEAIIRTIKSFKITLSDEEAWEVYTNTLLDENGICISMQSDEQSIEKWVERIRVLGNLEVTPREFVNKFTEEYLKTGYYKDVIEYAYSLKNKCKVGMVVDLIKACYPALNKQVDLSKFDYIWLSYQTHLRKKSEEIFALVEKETRIKPGDILFIDDCSENIKNAQKRGWNTCQAVGKEFEKIKCYVDNFLFVDN